jgi:predicted ATPase
MTSFIGRDRELVDVERLLSRHRLVTLAGAGGSGKTRLAVEVARTGRPQPDGVWFVDLSGLAEPGLLPSVVAAALELTPGAGQEPMHALADQIGDRATLIVLDNCEHLLASCARLVAALLARCPRIKILGTSREPLRINGETTYRVPALGLPETDGHQPTDVAALGNIAAIRLFVDRARLARTSFHWVRTTQLRLPTSASDSTACRWPSSLPRPGWRCWRLPRSWSGSATCWAPWIAGRTVSPGTRPYGPR